MCKFWRLKPFSKKNILVWIVVLWENNMALLGLWRCLVPLGDDFRAIRRDVRQCRTPQKAKHVTEVTPYKIAARFRVAPLSFSSLLFSVSANRGHFHVTNELSPSPYTRGPSSASSRCVIRSCGEGGTTRATLQDSLQLPTGKVTQ